MAKDSARVSRKEQRRQELERQQRRRRLQIGIPVVIVVLVLAALIALRYFAPPIEGVVEYGPQDQGHDENATFEVTGLPPVGGTHSPRWQNCGLYDQPVEDKYAVHSMEHGAVWVAYRPDLPQEDLDYLLGVVGDRSFILTSPFPGLMSPVVLTAWGLQLPIESLPDERIEEFIGRYRIGPQTPEPGAPCTDGIGVPTG